MGIEDKTKNVVMSIVLLIIVLLIIGSNSIITQINNGLTAVCNSGWPLASLFDPANGVMPLLIVIGVFLAAITLALGIGSAIKKGNNN